MSKSRSALTGLSVLLGHVFQFTWFKCGGLSVGLSWAHVLGDVFSASAFFNTWADLLSGHVPKKPLHVPNYRMLLLNAAPAPPSTRSPGEPLFLKKVDPVGDCWIAAGNGKTGTYCFSLTAEKLRMVLSKTSDPSRAAGIPPFELICGMVWKLLAKVNGGSIPAAVTICENDILLDRKNEAPSNGMEIGVVETELAIEKCDFIDLAKLIREKTVPVKGLIEGAVGEDGEEGDFIFYGANLTFVNLEGADVYGVKLKGHKAIMANITINGVGDKGVVLVLPGGEEFDTMITVVLPRNQIQKLKDEILNNLALSVM